MFFFFCEHVCQFADALMTSPAEDGAKSLDLQSLLKTLHKDPFSTRKQLPRTPESLSKSSADDGQFFF